MASVVKWVSTAGADCNTGDSYAQAYETIEYALSQITGNNVDTYQLNIVADGTYDFPSSRTVFILGAGTDSDTDPSWHFRGVDSSGDPALATIACTSGQGSGQMFYCSTGADLVKLSGLKFDFSPANDASNLAVWAENTLSSGGCYVEYCHFIGFDATHGSGERRVNYQETSGPSFAQTYTYCIFENMHWGTSGGDQWLSSGAVNGNKYDFNYNVFCFDEWTEGGGTMEGLLEFSSAVKQVGEYLRFYHNTVYIDLGSDTIDWIATAPQASGDMKEINFHSNAVWIDGTAADPFTAGTNSVGAFGGYDGGSATIGSGTIGYSVLATGPNLTQAELEAGGNGWYVEPLAAAATADNELYEQADTAVFNDPSSSYTWTTDGTYTHTLSKDLRLLGYETAALDGTPPGALPALPGGGEVIGDLEVGGAVDFPNPCPGDTIEFRVLFIDVGGTGVTAGELEIDIPAALIEGGSIPTPTLSAGSWDSGTNRWTVDISASDFEQAQFSFEVASGAAGQIHFCQARIEDYGTITTDTNGANDSLSIEVQVRGLGDPECDDGGPGPGAAYVDIKPFFEPAYWIDVDFRLKTTRNRVRGDYLISGISRRDYYEFDMKQYVLATNTSTNLRQGGVNVGDVFLLESDEPIQVSINGTTLYYPECTAVAMLLAESVTSVWVKNNSLEDEATIRFVITD